MPQYVFYRLANRLQLVIYSLIWALKHFFSKSRRFERITRSAEVMLNCRYQNIGLMAQNFGNKIIDVSELFHVLWVRRPDRRRKHNILVQWMESQTVKVLWKTVRDKQSIFYKCCCLVASIWRATTCKQRLLYKSTSLAQNRQRYWINVIVNFGDV